MSNKISDADARLALHSIEDQQRQVIAHIDMPRWYWWGVAVGWVALGVISDVANPWAAFVATLAFGAGHSVVAQHVLSGRHGSRHLSIHPSVVGRLVPLLMLGYLVVLTIVTVGLALLFDADGADHPGSIASCFAAIAVLLGGPNLMAVVRRRAEHNVGS